MIIKKAIFNPHFVSCKVEENALTEDFIAFVEKKPPVLVRIEGGGKTKLKFFSYDSENKKSHHMVFELELVEPEVLSQFLKNAQFDGLKLILECDEEGFKWLTFKVDHKMVEDAKLLNDSKFKITPNAFSFTTDENLDDYINPYQKEGYKVKRTLNLGSTVLVFQLTNPDQTLPFNGVFFENRHLPNKEDLEEFLKKTQKENTSIELSSKTDENNKRWLTFEVFENVQTL